MSSPKAPRRQSTDLDGLNALVTGGANGIGRAIVTDLWQRGAKVFFADTDVPAGKELSGELGERARFSKVDLLKENEINRWVDGIGRAAGEIHVLVNNAASDPRIPIAETTATAWDNLLARNLRAYFLTARAAVPWMPRNASIINLASITFHIGPANMTAYVASKGGIIGFTRALARELGPGRIRVNTVSPGWVMTERQLREFVTPAVKRLIRNSQCIPDLIQPNEIASVVRFLAGPDSRAMTGQELLVDRGWAYS